MSMQTMLQVLLVMDYFRRYLCWKKALKECHLALLFSIF